MKKNYIPFDASNPLLTAGSCDSQRFATRRFHLVCVFCALLLSATNTLAATITVTNGNDSGPGSLRQAILDVSSGDTINFAAGVTIINLTSNALVINKNLTLSGPGPSRLVVQRSSANSFPVFDIIPSSVAANISGLTISNGGIGGGSTEGGIYIEGAATVTNCVISNNITGALSYGFLAISNSIISNNGQGINGHGTTTVSACTIADNNAPGTSGGGIFNFITGNMTITSSTIAGNSAADGAGIYTDGSLTVTNSTISDNTATGSGGGIRNGDNIWNSGALNISDSTISGNLANVSGGGIYNYTGLSANVKSTLIALNTAPSGPDGSGAFASHGYNLVGKTDGTTGFIQSTDQTGTIANPLDPRLDPAGLQNNGGPTQTIAILANSPAINRGDPAAPPQDQRGYGRVGVPDVGAFEFGGIAPHPSFFTGEVLLGDGVYYLQFSNGTAFGYYSYLTDPHWTYHFDMGYEYWFDANDGHNGIYFYDLMSNHFFYSSPSFPFPYLYDFSLNTVLYYYPDTQRPGHYTTNPRYFYNFATGQIITM